MISAQHLYDIQIFIIGAVSLGCLILGIIALVSWWRAKAVNWWSKARTSNELAGDPEIEDDDGPPPSDFDPPVGR